MTDTGETALTQGHESHCHHGSDYVWVADENLVPDNDQSPILQDFPMGDQQPGTGKLEKSANRYMIHRGLLTFRKSKDPQVSPSLAARLCRVWTESWPSLQTLKREPHLSPE